MSRVLPSGEFGLIEKFKVFQNPSPVVVRGIGDDAAVLKLDRHRYQLFTTDMLVEDVHFSRAMLPRQVGHKALACSVSDIAAMGGVPGCAVVSLGVPQELAERYILEVYRGMSDCARTFGVSLVGGDTVRADKFVINVALLGEVEKKYLVTRGGARPGDRIFVTGALGRSFQSGRHLTFKPRLKEARFLVEHFKPTAMMDISDGLAGDIGHILQMSGVGAELDEPAVPLSRGADIVQALTDGEDFELLFTLSAARAEKLLRFTREKNIRGYYPVGRITGTPCKLFLLDATGNRRPIEPKGFVHF